MIHVMLQNEAKPVDQSTVELGSVAISGEVDTCSISTGDGWTEGRNRFWLLSVNGMSILTKPEE